jgi:DNA polymerase-3 subunit delta
MTAHPSPTFYVFHGSDEFTISEQVAEFRERMGPSDTAAMNVTQLDGRRVTLGEFRHACESIPFLSDKRLVIATGLLSRIQKEKGSTFAKELVNVLPRLPETTRLVFVETEALPERNAVLQLAEEHERGYAQRFEPPSERALPRWIEKRVQKYGGNVARDAVARLAQVVGSDLRLLDQEIQKLVVHAGEEEISAQHVERLVPYVQQAVIFDLVDALGQRNGQVAAATLHRLLEEGEHPMGILAMVARQFRLLIQVKELRQAGENASSIAKILKLHPYPTGKIYRQSINFTLPQLEKIYRHLLTIDTEIKTGQIAPEVALDLLVAGLTEPPPAR